MGLADVFNREDRVEVTFSNFYGMMKECTKAELLINAVNCDIPHRYIREMVTGHKEAVENVDTLVENLGLAEKLEHNLLEDALK